jgi:hypothetical protein
MAPKADEFVVDFPTLWIVPDWIEAHCIVPDGLGFIRRDPFIKYNWQLWVTVNHYRVKPVAKVGQLAPAFHNRRSQIVGPQKIGKGPDSATIVAAEGAGPVVFAGWAEGGELYDCRDYGCGCGWTYEYEPGEPMGRPWPTPLIQITATSEDQTDNVYRPLQSMVNGGPLGELMKVREGFIRLPNNGRIDVVTSSAQSRLGNPITFALQDETGIWTDGNRMRRVAETQRRGAAGMGGRTMETTNAWDPSEDSVAQRTAESKARDVFRFHRLPPAGLKYTVKADRRKIHAYVYAGAGHVDLDAIEGEAAEILEKDPGQAERFFGNRIVAGLGSWMDAEKWAERAKKREVPKGAPVVLGFDGSDVDDWTALRAETRDGYQFTPITAGGETIWNPAAYGGKVPRLEVHAAVEEVFSTFNVVRMYGDPPGWETEMDAWAEKYGDKRVIRWETYRPVPMHSAAERLLTDVVKSNSQFTHDGCETTALHMRNARKAPRQNQRYVLAKASQQQKIDSCVASIIAHEAAGDVTASDSWNPGGLTRVKGRASAY